MAHESSDVWKICPVGVSALAFYSDASIGHMLNQRSHWRSTVTTFDFGTRDRHANMSHIRPTIAALTMRPWAHGRFAVDLYIARPNLLFVRYVDEEFEGIQELPHTVLTSLIGKPISAYVDHPVFHGMTFHRASSTGIPRGPATDIPIDGDLGERIRARRAELLAAYPAAC